MLQCATTGPLSKWSDEVDACDRSRARCGETHGILLGCTGMAASSLCLHEECPGTAGGSQPDIYSESTLQTCHQRDVKTHDIPKKDELLIDGCSHVV